VDLKIVRHINRIFRKKGLTLSVAESCTGGLISHYLTAVPGASLFFEAGAVTYSAAAKKKLLGISQTVLTTHGMVSEANARLMAEKVRRLTRTDVALSTTGNLGPDILENKQKGLVYIAVSTGRGTVAREYLFKGTRGQIKEKASLSALAFLAEVIGNG
jgi:nicotinamide-nucleotide amidase